MKDRIKALVDKYIQVRWKKGKYVNIMDGYILRTTPTSFTFEVKHDCGHISKEQIKFKDVTEIKKWKEPICPLCKSTEIKDFNKSAYDGPNQLNHIITCCICKKCGIFFINKNDRNQCLWEN